MILTVILFQITYLEMLVYKKRFWNIMVYRLQYLFWSNYYTGWSAYCYKSFKFRCSNRKKWYNEGCWAYFSFGYCWKDCCVNGNIKNTSSSLEGLSISRGGLKINGNYTGNSLSSISIDITSALEVTGTFNNGNGKINITYGRKIFHQLQYILLKI